MQTSSDGTGLEAQAPAAGAEEARAQVRGSAWLLIGQMVGIAINLSAQVLVVRYLTKESFGAFAFALSICWMNGAVSRMNSDGSGVGFNTTLRRAAAPSRCCTIFRILS